MIEQLPFDNSAPKVKIDGIESDYFCGCGYHQFQDSDILRKAAQEILNEYPFKGGPSMYHLQESPAYTKFLETAQKFFDSETVITYPSGYLGNTLALRALKNDFDIIFHDEQSHFSMLDAIIITGKRAVPFNHLDPEDLRKKIQKNIESGQKPIIVSDAVIPTTGKIAPIPQYLEILDEVDEALLYMDDSHGTAVLGEHGRGTLEYFNIKDPRVYFAGTMSKGLGSHGGILPIAKDFVEKDALHSRIMTGSTPIPNPSLAASTAAMTLLMEDKSYLENLRNNAIYFKEGLRNIGIEIDITPMGIAAIPESEHLNIKSLNKFFRDHRIIANLIPKGQYAGVMKRGIIKFTVFSSHVKDQFDRVVEITEKFLHQ